MPAALDWNGDEPRIWSEAGEMIYGGVAAPMIMYRILGLSFMGLSCPKKMQRVSIPGILSYSSPWLSRLKPSRSAGLELS